MDDVIIQFRTSIELNWILHKFKLIYKNIDPKLNKENIAVVTNMHRSKK